MACRYKSKELVIKTAIQEYKNSTMFFGTRTTFEAKNKIVQTINMMENAFIMCAPFNVCGIDDLRKTIVEAKQKYKEIIAYVEKKNSYQIN